MSQIEKYITALEKLNKIEYDSRWPLHDIKNGKNKKIRADGERDLGYQIDIAKYVIKEFDLLTLKLGENRSDMDKGLWMSEFKKYFSDDIKEFIRLVKQKIEELEQIEKKDGMD